ncbi:hypothetical protein NMT49_003552 [Vibrio cholerae]|nr:hypothetical protein [Vibrio cholerae]
MRKALEFKPYSNYIELFDYIGDFVGISSLSYRITKRLLATHDENALSDVVLPKPEKEDLSFSMADVNVEGEFVCGWLRCKSYAEKINSDIDTVRVKAIEGAYGHIHNDVENEDILLIWPPEFQEVPLSELPPVGKAKFKQRVTLQAHASVDLEIDVIDDFEAHQKRLLKLAHAVGDKDEVSSNAEVMLFQSAFLLHWTAFEVFIKETIHELFRRHPKKLTIGQLGSKQNLSYKDVFELSSEFNSIEDLKKSLVEREIEKHQSNGESISGLINFLNREFKFERNPYESCYIFKGDKRVATKLRVDEIRDVRNTLMHTAGKDVLTLFACHPHLRNEDNNLIIDNEYFVDATLVMKNIAHSIALSVQLGKYQAINC